MAIRTFTVLVGSWGANPSFDRGETITVDSDAKNPFPYDVDAAVASGVLAETTEGADQAPAPTMPIGLLPSGAPTGIGAPAGAVVGEAEIPQAPAEDASAEESVLPPEESAPSTPARASRR